MQIVKNTTILFEPDSDFALAIELDDKGKGLVDWKEV